MTPQIRLISMGVIWIAWVAPFFLNRAKGQGKAVRIDTKARLGIFFVAAGFFIANTHGPRVWREPMAWWRLVPALLAAVPAILLAWTSVRNLGRQWRVEAGLNDDHQLVQSGAYRIVRHPIYLSILLMLLTTIAFTGTLPGWPFAIVLGLIGTEIRVRVEDALLEGRFGSQFTEWQRRVPAYLPFVR